MSDIPAPQPDVPDIYSYGFDKSLNRGTSGGSDNLGSMDQTEASSLSFGALTTGDHSNTFGSDPKDGIWLGGEKFADAPFRVTQKGVMYASAANIAGTITASVGTIGGWTVGANVISAGSGSAVVGLDSTVSGGDDIRIYAGSTPPNSAPFKVTEAGAVTASNITITGGSVSASTLNGAVPQANLNVANRNWVQTCAFTVTDADTIDWGTGTFTSADGTAYSISAGNTGNMAAKTYVYLDTGVSTTVYQTTTTAATASGAGKVLIAVCQNGTGEAKFMLFNDNSYNIDAANIVANSITANELSTSITYAGEIIISAAGDIRSGQTAYNTGTGWFIGNVGGSAKLSIGSSSTRYLTWDGDNLTINGYVQTNKGAFGGDGSDGALTITSGTTTIDCGSASTLVKNYTSISITSTGKLAFSNPGPNGTIVILKSQGGVTLTSSAPCIDTRNMGAPAATVGIGTILNTNKGVAGTAGTSGAGNGGGAGGATVLQLNNAFGRIYRVQCGAGGASGGNGFTDGTGGTGGMGGGGIIIECGGALNFTTSSGVNTSGANGSNGVAGGVGDAGGGGGGAAGDCIIFYNTLTASSGTILATGGTGGSGSVGAGSGSGGGGGGGGSRYAGGSGADGKYDATGGSTGQTGGAGGTAGNAGSGGNTGTHTSGGGGGGGAGGLTLVATNTDFV